jgi:hypothetical protein
MSKTARYLSYVGIALGLLAFYATLAGAQTIVIPQPAYIENGAANDFGNGPIEMKVLQGQASAAAATSSGVVASETATVLTMSATPTLPPCVGCVIQAAGATTSVVTSSGNTITITATIGALVNGTTVVAWGIPCTASPPAGVRVAPLVPGQPGGTDLPFNSSGRICGYAPNSPGALVLTFPIGAH